MYSFVKYPVLTIVCFLVCYVDNSETHNMKLLLLYGGFNPTQLQNALDEMRNAVDNAATLRHMKADTRNVIYISGQSKNGSQGSEMSFVVTDNHKLNLTGIKPAVQEKLKSILKTTVGGIVKAKKVIEEVLTSLGENQTEINYVGTTENPVAVTITEPTNRNCESSNDCSAISIDCDGNNGVYSITPDNSQPIEVLCEFKDFGGRWTVIQNRDNGIQDFNRTWSDYQLGFGDLRGEFWIGLENLYILTNQKQYRLYIELKSVNDRLRYAMYDNFKVGPESEGYPIKSTGVLTATEDIDALRNNVGMKFTAKDNNNGEVNCANIMGGAWWYNKDCGATSLNGIFKDALRFYWQTPMHYFNPLKGSRMMIRPTQS